VRAVPTAVGLVVLIAGALQFTAWKARHLAFCREAPGRGRTLPADAGTAWRHGRLRLGLHCSQCCVGLTAILLVIGVMELRAMAVVAAAITLERLAPAGERIEASPRDRGCRCRVASDRASNGVRMTRPRREPELRPSCAPGTSAPEVTRRKGVMRHYSRQVG
jgi:predicted metal-binding membrane protein